MTAELSGKRIAILAEDLYEDIELWYPYYRLLEAGATVTLVGSGRTEWFTGKHGLPVQADKSIDDVQADDYDGLIVPGGFAPDLMRRKPEMIELVRRMGNAAAPVAAICHATWALASAGLVESRRVTCFFSIKDDIVASGGKYVDEAVVVDGNIITSRMPADLPQFMPAFIEAVATQGTS